MSIEIKPSTLKEANAFVEQYHRHHKPTWGHKFSIKCVDGDRTVGVAIMARPLARMLDDGETLEVTRLCTDGTRNACSMLYGACARIAKDMGCTRIITYILQSENGASLKASGWTKCAENVGGGSWDRPNRRRTVTQVTLFGEEQKYPTEEKTRWERRLKGE